MSAKTAKLYLLCGKIASGKSTLSLALAKAENTILLSEDHWNSTLYPEEIKNIQDYVKYSKRIRAVVGPLVISLLREGTSVVMDFPANTLEQRAWLKSLFDEAQSNHELYYLDCSDALCKER
ncbi:MAG: ATP-binding protein, partial [Alphaproteobacteria bacterium]|nr:ATP-binding protein [Alphaproteobacteria bacterium]